MSKPALLEAIRPKLDNRLRRAMDAGPVLLVGVFRQPGRHYIGLRFRTERRKYEYVAAWEDRIGQTFRVRVTSHVAGFPWGEWCEDGGSERLAACRRLRDKVQRRMGNANKHSWATQQPRGAADVSRHAIHPMQPE